MFSTKRLHTSVSVRALSILTLGAALGACEESSDGPPRVAIPPSTIEVDDVPSRPGTAWIRIDGEGSDAFVELLDFRGLDPAAWVDEPRVLTRFTFRRSGATEIDRGVASPSTEAGEGALSFAESWRYAPDPTTPAAMRPGAAYAPISPRVDDVLRFDDVGGLLEVSIDSRSVRFENLSGVIERTLQAHPVDDEGASRVVAQLFFLAMSSSWARVEGYDSSGIVDYQGAGRTVPALVVAHDASAAVHVSATLGSSIEWSFDYSSYVDFDGVMIDGSTSIAFGSDGGGTMSGAPQVTLSSGASSLSATVDVSGVEVIDGIPTSGSVEVVIGTTSRTFDAETLLHPDLSNAIAPM